MLYAVANFDCDREGMLAENSTARQPEIAAPITHACRLWHVLAPTASAYSPQADLNVSLMNATILWWSLAACHVHHLATDHT